MADLYEIEVEPEVRTWLEACLTETSAGSTAADAGDLLARGIVLLTVFRKTRSAETAEVRRAVAAQQVCESSHDVAHHFYERKGAR